jgi:hypothetical protein
LASRASFTAADFVSAFFRAFGNLVLATRVCIDRGELRVAQSGSLGAPEGARPVSFRPDFLIEVKLFGPRTARGDCLARSAKRTIDIESLAFIRDQQIRPAFRLDFPIGQRAHAALLCDRVSAARFSFSARSHFEAQPLQSSALARERGKRKRTGDNCHRREPM